jgi:tRNA pseudouridine55 synthase
MYNKCGDTMDGILLLNKPIGLSSHDCVNIARRAFSTRKVGHSGTLDPEASGVLVLALNKGTRILEFLNQDDKLYEFEVCFNQTTNTLDHTGHITRETLNHSIKTEKLDEAMKSFEGTYIQTPPAFAAVKVDGKKLYEYAREGKKIPEVPPRTLTIYTFKRLSEPVFESGLVRVWVSVHGSKGLYVRKLSEDLASKLDTLAHTTAIHRVKAGKFSVDQSISLEHLKEGKAPLMSMNSALSHIPSLTASKEMVVDISHGKKLAIAQDAPLMRLIDETGALLAIYIKQDSGIYKPKKVFISGGQS